MMQKIQQQNAAATKYREKKKHKNTIKEKREVIHGDENFGGQKRFC